MVVNNNDVDVNINDPHIEQLKEEKSILESKIKKMDSEKRYDKI